MRALKLSLNSLTLWNHMLCITWCVNDIEEVKSPIVQDNIHPKNNKKQNWGPYCVHSAGRDARINMQSCDLMFPQQRGDSKVKSYLKWRCNAGFYILQSLNVGSSNWNKHPANNFLLLLQWSIFSWQAGETPPFLQFPLSPVFWPQCYLQRRLSLPGPRKTAKLLQTFLFKSVLSQSQ